MNAIQRKKLTVILNAGSGTLVQLGAEKVAARLRAIYASAGCEAKIQIVEGDGLPAAFREVLQDPPEALVIGGGDGTVAAAAGMLAHGDIPLGILPLGTFNLAARDVGMPLDWEEAAAVLVEAPVRRMDLLEIHGRMVLCLAVLGFYPALALGKREYHGHWLVKTWQTIVSSLRSAATFPPLQLHIEHEGTVTTCRTRMALLANNDYANLFGLVPQRTSLDGGFCTLYVSRHLSRWGLSRSVLSWILGRWEQDREITIFRARHLRIDVRRHRQVPVMLDGETVRLPLPLEVKLWPQALAYLSPLPADAPAPAAHTLPLASHPWEQGDVLS